MKKTTYLNGVLTVIAACLVLIVMATLNILPSAHADGLPRKQIMLPVNDDGSVNVKIISSDQTLKVDVTDISTNDEIDVNIAEINDWGILARYLPVEVRD